jgi:hypothetical protein
MLHIRSPILVNAVNQPTPPHPEPVSPREAAVASLRAWHELRQQMVQLHAQLHYLRLLVRLGVGSR